MNQVGQGELKKEIVEIIELALKKDLKKIYIITEKLNMYKLNAI